jgi:V8-like Glu-specific endopeptidase
MRKIFALFLILTSTTSWALPTAPFNALAKNLKLKSSLQNQEYDFEGIVKLSNCSGSLIILNGMPTSAKAIVMTNGHCIQKPGGYLEPGEVWHNKEIYRTMKIYDSAMELHLIRAEKILYATMTDTDVAYYQLSETYDEIKSRTNIDPYTLDTIRPYEAQEIEIISGYWDRGYSCSIENFVFKLKEGQWTWTDSIRYTETCDTICGTSGSPIIAKGERRVIGVNNTSNQDGISCALNNPCEVDEEGNISAFKDVRYGQQTYPLYSCLTVDFNIDLSLDSCQLPR